jgi:DNA-binding NtrC family response regulator
MGRILIAYRELATRRLILSNLLRDDHQLSQVENVKALRQRLNANEYDGVFIEEDLPDGNALELIAAAVATNPAMSVLILATGSTVPMVTERFHNAIFHVFAKPFQPELMRIAAHRACERAFLIRENSLLKQVVAGIEQEISKVVQRGDGGVTHNAWIASDSLQMASQPGSPYDREQRELPNAANSITASFQLSAVLDQIEKDLVVRTLSAARGVQAEAARRMGLSRSALAYKLNKHGIRG